MHSCFFPRLTAKITFMLKSQLSQTRKTHREISFMCMYIFFYCISIDLSKQYISLVTFFTPNPYLQIHINITFRKFLHATHPALRMSARVSLKCFNQRASKRRISFVATCTLCWRSARIFVFLGQGLLSQTYRLGQGTLQSAWG